MVDGRRWRKRRLPLPLLLLLLLLVLLLPRLLLLLLQLLSRLLYGWRQRRQLRRLLLHAWAHARRLPHRIVLVSDSEVNEGAATIIGELPRQLPESGITRGRRGIRKKPRAIQTLPTSMAGKE
jgi:hypothetical protein